MPNDDGKSNDEEGRKNVFNFPKLIQLTQPLSNTLYNNLSLETFANLESVNLTRIRCPQFSLEEVISRLTPLKIKRIEVECLETTIFDRLSMMENLECLTMHKLRQRKCDI